MQTTDTAAEMSYEARMQAQLTRFGLHEDGIARPDTTAVRTSTETVSIADHPEELRSVIDSWSRLSPSVRDAIMLLIYADQV